MANVKSGRAPTWLVVAIVKGKVYMTQTSVYTAMQAAEEAIQHHLDNGFDEDDITILYVGRGKFGENEIASITQNTESGEDEQADLPS